MVIYTAELSADIPRCRLRACCWVQPDNALNQGTLSLRELVELVGTRGTVYLFVNSCGTRGTVYLIPIALTCESHLSKLSPDTPLIRHLSKLSPDTTVFPEDLEAALGRLLTGNGDACSPRESGGSNRINSH